jgi:hypothetical protein
MKAPELRSTLNGMKWLLMTPPGHLRAFNGTLGTIDVGRKAPGYDPGTDLLWKAAEANHCAALLRSGGMLLSRENIDDPAALWIVWEGDGCSVCRGRRHLPSTAKLGCSCLRKERAATPAELFQAIAGIAMPQPPDPRQLPLL